MVKFKLGALAASVVLACVASVGQAAPVLDQANMYVQNQIGMAMFPSILPAGQSFTAGMSGRLDRMDFISNGPIQNGSNTLAFEVHDGSGVSGSLLGTGTQTVSSVLDPNAGNWLISIDTAGLGIGLLQGQQYTLDFTNVTGPGDLALRGLIGNTSGAYAGGRAYFGWGYGDQPQWDLQFRTWVDAQAPGAVPEPGSAAIVLTGLALLGWTTRRRARTQKP